MTNRFTVVNQSLADERHIAPGFYIQDNGAGHAGQLAQIDNDGLLVFGRGRLNLSGLPLARFDTREEAEQRAEEANNGTLVRFA